jgi:hypothetical protein
LPAHEYNSSAPVRTSGKLTGAPTILVLVRIFKSSRGNFDEAPNSDVDRNLVSQPSTNEVEVSAVDVVGGVIHFWFGEAHGLK